MKIPPSTATILAGMLCFALAALLTLSDRLSTSPFKTFLLVALTVVSAALLEKGLREAMNWRV